MKYNTVEPREVSEAREVNIFNTTKRTHTQKKREFCILRLSFKSLFVGPNIFLCSLFSKDFKTGSFLLYRQSGRRRSAKLVPTFADRGVSRGQRNGSPRPFISVFWTGATTFYSSSSSIDLTRLSGPRSRPITTQKIW